MCRSEHELEPGRRGRGSLRRPGCSQKRGFTNNQPRLRQRLRRLPTPSSSGVSGQRAHSLSGPGAPPAPGPLPHRALVPAAGEERPPRKGQPELRTRTSAAERPCAPHFTVSSALSHAPSPTRQGAQSLCPHLHRGTEGGEPKAGPGAQKTAPGGSLHSTCKTDER